MDTGTYGARRPVRVTVAVILTLLTAAYVLTMVEAALGEPDAGLAQPFFFTGVLVLVLAWASLMAWRWVGRARHEQALHPPLEGVLDDGGHQDHIGLTGEVEPPKRW